MRNYDFTTTLSPLDFELLSKDLLEAELDIRLENFREGRDKGIDLRYAPVQQRQSVFISGIPQNPPVLIVQCKRYATFTNLKSELANNELPKILKLKPERYVITTSVSLSPQQVDELKAILSPFVLTTGDIFGRERLNAALDKHQEIERRHIKLWVGSAGVLDSILNARTHVVSREEVERTIATAKLYVRNDSFDEALAILKKHRVCIISGLPGIGKTTLARMLLLYFYDKKFDVIKIESDISEARDVAYHNNPRFYYYDDFLGQTQVTERVQQERGKIAADEAKKAKLALSNDIEQKTKEVAELQEILKKKDEKLSEAQKAQADLLKKQRELDDAKRELDLTIEKRVSAGLTATRQQARKEAEDELKLKVSEKEQTIVSMQKQIEDLKRRAEQGSQQLQGEVQELELEAMLKAKFPHDTIAPVPKGEHGGDVLQRVISPLGQQSGTILWESKRTKNWSDGWLSKLRDDQRTAKAEIAVIISQVLPKSIETFGLIDGVWVTQPQATLPVAVALRYTLIETANARVASEGQQTKMELIYQYLTGPRFRQRVQAIVEAFSSMKEDLDKEKKAILKQWAKREAQNERVMQSTVGMYGDLQGIAGKTIQEIEGLEMKALEDTASD